MEPCVPPSMEPTDSNDLSWLVELVGDADVPGRVIRPSRYSVTGYISTTKAAKSQAAESSLEQDFLTLLEADHRVERFLAQPFTIRWTDATGKRQKYTPDVIVKYTHWARKEAPTLRTTIFEVKPRSLLGDELKERRSVFRAAIGWARARSCLFHFVTDQEIRTPYLQNVKFLRAYGTKQLQDDHDLIVARQSLIQATLRRLQRTTPRDLLQAMSTNPRQQAELLPWVWNLILCNSVGVDLQDRLTMSSPIWCVET